MLDPNMFSNEGLLSALLKDGEGNLNWRRYATIIPKYRAPGDRDYEESRCVIMLKYQRMTTFLRYSKGPRQGHWWDIYGDDYQTPELALIALLEAEPPRWLLCNTDKLVTDD